MAASTKPSSKYFIKVESINIIKILSEKNFDWIKMDIEWAEYECLDKMIENDIFNFKKGFIEFHILWDKHNIEKIYKYYKFLELK